MVRGEKVKAVGVDHQAPDHLLATAIGPHGTGPLLPEVCEEYKRETGREVGEDFPEWEPLHRLLLGNGIMGWENVGGDIDEVVGKRVTIAGFPIRWEKGDGSIVRLVAMVEERGERIVEKVELKDAKPHQAPGHFGMTALKLHGREETGCRAFWVGPSHFLRQVLYVDGGNVAS